MNKIHHFKKNKKIFIKLKNGESIIGRYHEIKGKYLKLMKGDPIRLNKIRCMTFYDPLYMKGEQK